jgi:uncharacterized integral membrane protein
MNRRLFAANFVGLLLGLFLGSFVGPPVKNQAIDYLMGVARWPLLVLSALGLTCCWKLYHHLHHAPHSCSSFLFNIYRPTITEAEQEQIYTNQKLEGKWSGLAELLIFAMGGIFLLLLLAAATAGSVSIYPPDYT